MKSDKQDRLPDISRLSTPVRWLIMLALTAGFAFLLHLLALPASFLQGAMAAGVLVAITGGAVRIPVWVFLLSQAIIGAMIGRSISADALEGILERWPLFVLMVLSVSVVASVLGWFLTKTKVLPGTTAIWGTSPGAAMVMTMMSESYGADSRLVAFMQYLRVMMVSVAASLVARIWGQPVESAVAVAEAIADTGFDYYSFTVTMAVVVSGALLGLKINMPAFPLLFPLVAGTVLNVSGAAAIELPWWLLILAYCTTGWAIGLRFTRQIVIHALHALPRIFATILFMIVICGVFAAIFGYAIGVDPLTAYLATSPGGMDSVAIIAASIGGNMSFVMAVQTTRFIMVAVTAPTFATFAVKRLRKTE